MPDPSVAAPADAIDAVLARTGCRVDLAGGTLDLWPLGLFHRDAQTVNVAIDLPIAVRLTRRDRGYRVRQGTSQIDADDVAGLRAQPDTPRGGGRAPALTLPPVAAPL
ncbi:MAG: hypothetical protein AAF772_15170, partial [Acidobacteriota bacterium]